MTNEDAAHLREIASPVVRRGKVDRGEMVGTILALCAERFLTPVQLASLLNRSSEGLRKRFLTPMVRDGLLRQKYPAATNRPDQAYTTADDE